MELKGAAREQVALGKVWVLKEPERGNREWNMYMLREAARLKRWLDGVYYSPRLGRLLAVFRPTPGTHVNRLVFEEMPESIVKESYRMECPSGCNRCCVIHSGAFMFDIEVQALPDEYRSLVERQPSELMRTPWGKFRVYRLDTLPMGRCIFFDVEKGRCRLEAELGRRFKPIVCLLTYCTVFASRNGKLYLKTGYRVLKDGRVLMKYREASKEEWNTMVRKMGSVWLKYRRVQRRMLEEHGGEALAEAQRG